MKFRLNNSKVKFFIKDTASGLPTRRVVVFANSPIGYSFSLDFNGTGESWKSKNIRSQGFYEISEGRALQIISDIKERIERYLIEF